MRDLLNAAINVAQVRKYMRLEKFSEFRFIECYIILCNILYNYTTKTNLSLAGLYVFRGKSFYSSGYCCQVKIS